PAAVPPLDDIPEVEYGTWEILRRGSDIAILAVGTMVLPALDAARELAGEGIDATVVNCRFLKPFDDATLTQVAAAHRALLVVEEGTVVNGFGAAVAARLHREPDLDDLRIRVHGVPDHIIEH